MARRHIISQFGPDVTQQRTQPGFGGTKPRVKGASNPPPKSRGAGTFRGAAKKAPVKVKAKLGTRGTR